MKRVETFPYFSPSAFLSLLAKACIICWVSSFWFGEFSVLSQIEDSNWETIWILSGFFNLCVCIYHEQDVRCYSKEKICILCKYVLRKYGCMCCMLYIVNRNSSHNLNVFESKHVHHCLSKQNILLYRNWILCCDRIILRLLLLQYNHGVGKSTFL